MKYLNRVVRMAGILALFVMGLYFASVQLVMADGLAGEYTYNDSTVFQSPANSRLIDSSGTGYNIVDSMWNKVSTNTADGATNKTAVNVRVATATAIPITTKSGDGLTINNSNANPTRCGLDASSNTVVVDNTKSNPTRVGLDASSNTVVVDNTKANPTRVGIDASSNTVVIDNTKVNPVRCGVDASSNVVRVDNTQVNPTRVGLDASSNTVKVDNTQINPTRVGIDASSNSVKAKNDDATYWVYGSSSMVVYPNTTGVLAFNAEATNFHAFAVGGSTVAWTASWGLGTPAMAVGYNREERFSVPTSSPATVTCTLGEYTTAYFTIGGRRLK